MGGLKGVRGNGANLTDRNLLFGGEAAGVRVQLLDLLAQGWLGDVAGFCGASEVLFGSHTDKSI